MVSCDISIVIALTTTKNMLDKTMSEVGGKFLENLEKRGPNIFDRVSVASGNFISLSTRCKFLAEVGMGV